MRVIIQSIADQPIIVFLKKNKDSTLGEIRIDLLSKGISYKDRSGLIHRMNNLISKGLVKKTPRLTEYPIYNITKKALHSFSNET